MHWAQELGTAGLKIASAAQATSFRNTPVAAKAMSGNIIDLVVTKHSHLSLCHTHKHVIGIFCAFFFFFKGVLHGMRKSLLGRVLSSGEALDILSVASTLVGLGSEIVFKIGRDETEAEQIQMRILLALGTIWEVSTGAPLDGAALRGQIAQIHDMSVALSQRIGNDLVLFSSACVPLLAEDYIAERSSSSSNGNSSSNMDGTGGELALTNALAKLAGLVRSATATRTLRDVIVDLRHVIEDIGEAKEVESIHSLGPLAQTFIAQMEELTQRAFGYDQAGFAGIAEVLERVADQLLWGCRAVSELISEESGARGNYDRVAGDVIALVTQLRNDILVHTQRQGKDQPMAIKISCTAFQLCEAFIKLLRTSLGVQRFMKRKGTLFDEDDVEVPIPEGGSACEDGAGEDEDEPEAEAEAKKSGGNGGEGDNNNNNNNDDDDDDDNIVDDSDEDDCDVWKEPPDSPANIVLDADGNVRAGNLNKLIERLTMVKGQDITFQKTFVTTYRSFTTPETFFRKLRQRFNMDIPHLPPSVSPSEYRKLFILPVQLRVINVLRQWIDTSIFDINDALVARIRTFIATELDHEAFRNFSRQLSDLLTRKLEERRTAAETEKSERAIVEDAVATAAAAAAAAVSGSGSATATGTATAEAPSTGDNVPAASATATDAPTAAIVSPREAGALSAAKPVDATTAAAVAAAAANADKESKAKRESKWMTMRTKSRMFRNTTYAKTLSTFTSMVMGTGISLERALPLKTGNVSTLDDEVMSPEGLQVFKYSAEDVAEQLTFLDSHYYYMIRPVELLNKSWSKNKGARSPNVTKLIRRFNEVSQWVATLILAQKTAAARAVMWGRFVVIGDALLRLKNFNTLLAILSAFNLSAVNRLRGTRRLLPQPMTEWIEAQMKLMTSEGSYHIYRETLHTVDPPSIPYLGVYLTDLTFIEDGNQNFVNGGLINFKKRQMIYNIISEVQLYQQDRYDIPPNLLILPLLSTLESKNEDELYKLSLIREPRTGGPIA